MSNAIRTEAELFDHSNDGQHFIVTRGACSAKARLGPSRSWHAYRGSYLRPTQFKWTA